VNSIRHIENRFSPFIYFLFLMQALTSGGFRIVSDTLVTTVILSSSVMPSRLSLSMFISMKVSSFSSLSDDRSLVSINFSLLNARSQLTCVNE